MNMFHRFFTRALFVLCLISASNSVAILPGCCIPEIAINPAEVFMDKAVDVAKKVAVIAFFAWLGLPNPIPTDPVLGSPVLTTVYF